MPLTDTEGKLKGMLSVAGVPVKASYTLADVRALFDISANTAARMVNNYEVDPETGGPRHPATLDSYMTRGHRRVRFEELVGYLARNRTCDRQNAVDARQMDMF